MPQLFSSGAGMRSEDLLSVLRGLAEGEESLSEVIADAPDGFGAIALSLLFMGYSIECLVAWTKMVLIMQG